MLNSETHALHAKHQMTCAQWKRNMSTCLSPGLEFSATFLGRMYEIVRSCPIAWVISTAHLGGEFQSPYQVKGINDDEGKAADGQEETQAQIQKHVVTLWCDLQSCQSWMSALHWNINSQKLRRFRDLLP